MSNRSDYLLKVVLVGNSGVGKSSLLQRYSKNSFDAGYVSTIGVDFEVKTVRMHERVAKVQLWDTAGALLFELSRFKLLCISFVDFSWLCTFENALFVSRGCLIEVQTNDRRALCQSNLTHS